MYNKFNSFMQSVQKFTDRLSQIVCSPRATIAFYWACIEAEKRFVETGIRHYVIPSAKHRVLRVTQFNSEMHQQGLSMTKHRGYHNRDLTKPSALMDQAFYWTRSHRSRFRWRKPMSPATQRFRRQMFYSWWNQKERS